MMCKSKRNLLLLYNVLCCVVQAIVDTVESVVARYMSQNGAVQNMGALA